MLPSQLSTSSDFTSYRLLLTLPIAAPFFLGPVLLRRLLLLELDDFLPFALVSALLSKLLYLSKTLLSHSSTGSSAVPPIDGRLPLSPAIVLALSRFVCLRMV